MAATIAQSLRELLAYEPLPDDTSPDDVDVCAALCGNLAAPNSFYCCDECAILADSDREEF